MRVIHLHATRKGGATAYSVPFQRRLTFLTGINGSGKTTIVRLLDAILDLRVRQLVNLRFERVSIEVEDHGEADIVTLENNGESCRLSHSAVSDTLEVPLRDLRERDSARSATSDSSVYESFVEAMSGHPVVALLRGEAAVAPIFIDLERRLDEFSDSALDRALAQHVRMANRHLARHAGPVGNAVRLAEEAYSRFSYERQLLLEDLKRALILAAVERQDERTWDAESDVDRLRKTLRERATLIDTLSSTGIGAQALSQRLEPTFKDVAAFVEKYAALPSGESIFAEEHQNLAIDYFSVKDHIDRILSLAQQVSEYSEKVRDAQSPIENYRTLVNSFFQESGKVLTFTERGQLRIDLPDGQSVAPNELSSGERQLLTILTHLTFHPRARRSSLLMIDEPELSFHVSWQAKFVPALMELTESRGTQVILATHSPAIIGSRVANCVDAAEFAGPAA